MLLHVSGNSFWFLLVFNQKGKHPISFISYPISYFPHLTDIIDPQYISLEMDFYFWLNSTLSQIQPLLQSKRVLSPDSPYCARHKRIPNLTSYARNRGPKGDRRTAHALNVVHWGDTSIKHVVQSTPYHAVAILVNTSNIGVLFSK